MRLCLPAKNEPASSQQQEHNAKSYSGHGNGVLFEPAQLIFGGAFRSMFKAKKLLLHVYRAWPLHTFAK